MVALSLPQAPSPPVFPLIPVCTFLLVQEKSPFCSVQEAWVAPRAGPKFSPAHLEAAEGEDGIGVIETMVSAGLGVMGCVPWQLVLLWFI